MRLYNLTPEGDIDVANGLAIICPPFDMPPPIHATPDYGHRVDQGCTFEGRVDEGCTFVSKLDEPCKLELVQSTTTTTGLSVPAAPTLSDPPTFIGTTEIDLAVTDNSAGSATSFTYQSSTVGATGPWTTFAVVRAPTLTVQDLGLAQGTSIWFQALASNNAGASSPSNVVATATLSPVGSPPAAPTFNDPTVVSQTQINLSLTDNSAGAATKFYFEHSSSSSGGPFVQFLVTDAPLLTGSDSDLISGQEYWFRARCSNASGYSGYSNVVSATTNSGSNVPLGTVAALPIDEKTIDIAWTDVGGADYTKIQLSATGTGGWVTVKTVPGNWTETKVGSTAAFPIAASQTMYVRVIQGNEVRGDFDPSPTASVTTFAPGLNASPTGRVPRTMWNAFWQADMARVKVSDPDNPGAGVHPAYTVLKNAADTPSTAPGGFGRGSWEPLMYQITGDPAYAALAWARIQPTLSVLPGTGGGVTPDTLRQFFPLYCIWYEILKPWLIANGLLATYWGYLNAWAAWCCGNVPGSGFSFGDTDQQSSQYYGLALTDLLTGPDNPQAGTWLSTPFTRDQFAKGKSCGGLDATAAGAYATMRNHLQLMGGTWAKGGIWCESSGYNLNTRPIEVASTEAIRTAVDWLSVDAGSATGVEHFPEFRQWATYQLPWHKIWECTPGLELYVQWGDLEAGHPPICSSATSTKWATDAVVAAGISARTAGSGPYMAQLISDLATKYGWTSAGVCFSPYGYLLWTPYTVAADWRGAFDATWISAGMNEVIYNDSWGKNGNGSTAGGVFWTADFVELDNINHLDISDGDFQVLFGGQPVITHPLGYAGAMSNTHRSKNCKALAGLPSMRGSDTPNGSGRGAYAREADVGPFRFAYQRGGSKGPYYNPITSDFFTTNSNKTIPPSFVNEDTRARVYLPSSDASSGVVVVFDRCNLINPNHQTVTYKGTIYPASAMYSTTSVSGITDKGSVTGCTALVVSQYWVPNTATASGQSYSYTVGSIHGQLDILLPTTPTINRVAASTIFTKGGFSTKELAYDAIQVNQATALPADATPQYTTFLASWCAFTAAVTYTSTLVQSSDSGATAQGVLVQRTGCNDAVIMFNADQNNFVLPSGYTFTYTQASATADVFLEALDPAKSWTAAVDGGAPQALTVTDCSTGPNYPSTTANPASGNAKFQVSGAGSHTIVLAAA